METRSRCDKDESSFHSSSSPDNDNNKFTEIEFLVMTIADDNLSLEQYFEINRSSTPSISD